METTIYLKDLNVVIEQGGEIVTYIPTRDFAIEPQDEFVQIHSKYRSFAVEYGDLRDQAGSSFTKGEALDYLSPFVGFNTSSGGSGGGGIDGEDGDSAYQVAVNNGFSGTESEWLESLKPYPNRAEALREYVKANSYVYSAPTNTVVVSNVSELQAQENAPNGTEIQIAAGAVIDVSGSVVRFDFNNSVHLTSQDLNNKGRILLGELGSHLRFNGEDSTISNFIYSGTWVHANRPRDIDPLAPDTVGVVVYGDRFNAYRMEGSGFSYACIDLKASLNAHVQECYFYDVRATGLGYCIVLNGDSTLTAYKNEYNNYRHTIAKASDSQLQGYTDLMSYIGKGGVISSYGYDSHGEPDAGHPSGTNEFAGSYMNVIDCYFEYHDELCVVSRGTQRVEMIVEGNTFVRSNRSEAIRQTTQGVVLSPNQEVNVSDSNNLYLGQRVDEDIQVTDEVYLATSEGLFSLNLYTKKRELLSINSKIGNVYCGDFFTTNEALAINRNVIQIYKSNQPVIDAIIPSGFTPKGFVVGRFLQGVKDELIAYSDTEVRVFSFDTGLLVEQTILTTTNLDFCLVGFLNDTSGNHDLITVDTNKDHFLHPNNSGVLAPAQPLGNWPLFEKGHVMELFPGNDIDGIIFYDEDTKIGYRTRMLGGVYRTGDPLQVFTIADNNEKFFVKRINGVERLFNYGEGGYLKVFKASGTGFTGISLLTIAHIGEVNSIC